MGSILDGGRLPFAATLADSLDVVLLRFGELDEHHGAAEHVL